ncbi:MAG: FAD-dependent oxidoreductase [Gammaproteobacteria bacterium]|nr:FAD-dependent oxidoreductase [Gammaproteobacteria bacterium]MYC51633.1 FAD-dependent oxidoreductase [Gammaproteobacteria bacterium]
MRSADIGGSFSAVKVIVVGAGAAGLAAAYALRKRGLEFTVLEAADRAGGRIAVDEVDGFRIDIGAQVFAAGYDTALRLCRELGVPVRAISRRAGIWSRGAFRVVDQNDPWRNLRTLLAFKLFSPGGLWQLLRLGWKLRRRAADLSFADPSGALALDTDASVADWIRMTGGTESLEGLAGTSIRVLTLAEPEEVGAAYGMTLLWGFTFQPSELLTPERGMGQFTQALVAAVADQIRLSTSVERVIIREGAVAGVQTAAGFVAADAVVCATTATEARRLLPDLPADICRALGRVTYSSNCRVVFGVDRPVLPDQCYFVALPRREGSFVVDYSDAVVKSPRVAPSGRLIHAESASHRAESLSALPDGDLCRRFLSEIRRYSPEMPEPRFARAYRRKEAVCLMPSGALAALAQARRSLPEQIRGLALAGDYMHLPSVEGAVASGIAAVEDLL